MNMVSQTKPSLHANGSLRFEFCNVSYPFFAKPCLAALDFRTSSLFAVAEIAK